MNYRHAFHAGNFADVIKHIILTRILSYMQRKEAGLRVLDTHAGIGLYDLTSEEAQRSPEWEQGIKALLAAQLDEEVQQVIAPYLEIVKNLNEGDKLTRYPGSPLIAQMMLRPQDRLSAIELHPQDIQRLEHNLAGDRKTKVTHLDGWQALVAHVPPKEKRGVILVDPPFEKAGEFGRLADGVKKAHRRFSGGVYALWYPIKDNEAKEHFLLQLRESGIGKILRIEFFIDKPSSPPKLHGTGMIVVNPPYVLHDEMKKALPALLPILAPSGRGRVRVEWLRED
ncbi:23S rRNA (adenine2030-N6)-methyltransferase [Maritalea mobilis]|uniref:Ribosomal RNA large subunit methyltransferase J n=1 Tax=Maritalea mobilis TaxID=483324 RepID=A0A4R6VJG2_9HYPH|nr:23S rRNA (adenine(2030)-N(6))-methyltransferase RlmJ [Maritalea mobilis]TDQ61736.1 23S rRNA (adenine2030-N6)-methyltransferase [Maritalea mobilis]